MWPLYTEILINPSKRENHLKFEKTKKSVENKKKMTFSWKILILNAWPEGRGGRGGGVNRESIIVKKTNLRTEHFKEINK